MRITIGLIFLTLAAALPARADRRSFIRSYEFQTQPAGNLEFEMWNEVESPRGSIADSLITHKLELEYGVTDRFDVALYHVFQQGGPPGADTGFHFDSWRAETRYRLAECGEWPVDVMLYFEVERPAALGEPFEIEQKIIFVRDFGPLGLVANLVVSQKLASDARAGHLWEIDLGARYELAPWLRVAGELWGIQQIAPGGTRDLAFYAGPSVSVQNKKFWLQIGAGVGINDAAQGMQLRSVFGFNL